MSEEGLDVDLLHLVGELISHSNKYWAYDDLPRIFSAARYLVPLCSALKLVPRDQAAERCLQGSQVASMMENDDPSGVHILMSVKRSSASRNRPFQSCASFSRELKKASMVMSKNLTQVVSYL